jgi:hypothetical protein
MKRICIILALGASALVAFAARLLVSSADDVSKVRVGFANYTMVDGQRGLALVVTNGSSHYLHFPVGYQISGEKANGGCSMASLGIGCGIRRVGWGWWQLQFPTIPSIAPGDQYCFTVPVGDGDYTWCVKLSLTTIPFRERLPYALRSRWPTSKRNQPLRFTIETLPIPPAPETPWLPFRRAAVAPEVADSN